MRVKLLYIVLMCCIFIQSGCNTEEGLEPVNPPTFFKILEGEGIDDPIAIRTLSDGNLLVVSNSESFEQGQRIRKIRLLKLDSDGNILNDDKDYRPEGEESESWSARDVLIMDNNDILIAATIQNSLDIDSSLLFFKINENLEIINSSAYQNEATYDLIGIEQSNNELIFIAEEYAVNDRYPIIGKLNADNLEVIDVQPARRYDVPPATKVFKNEAGEFIWAYNRNNDTRSYLARVQPNLLLVNDQEINLGNSVDTKAEKLLMREGNPIVFGEVKINQRDQIFYHNQNSGNSFVFGSSANTLLNNVQMTPDGFLVTGYQDLQIEGSENRQRNYFLSRRNENGGEIFSKTFGTDDNQELTDAVLHNGSIISIGKTVFDGENTLVLIKTDAFGQLKN